MFLRRIKASYIVIPACLLLLGFFVYDHMLARDFWLDEAATANIIAYPISEVLSLSILDYHPPFYIYLIKFWSLAFGDGELSLRSFSALFAGIFVWLIYLTAKTIFREKKTALCAAFIAATNYFLIWFATQARPYTLAAALGLASFYFFVRSLENPSKKNLTGYIIFASLGIYTHPWLSLVFASQFFSLLLFRKAITSPVKIVISQIIIGLLAIPNVFIMFSNA